jgi:uncharacterized protein
MIEPEKSFEGLNITFNTNEDCNLACVYCYEINKKHKVLPIEYAQKFIDIILTDPDPIGVTGTPDSWMLNKGLVLDFIGGDSLMHPDLLEKILAYFVYKINTFTPSHKWCNRWRASISSNGTLFEDKRVRDFVDKWGNVLSLGISIDGCPTVHDKNRIMAQRGPYGEEIGSMQYILKWWPWLQEHHPASCYGTKSTCSRESIPYLFESLQYMHEEMKMAQINQNFIMEANRCTEEDYKLLEEQLSQCIAYVFDHRREMYWSMIDKKFARIYKNDGNSLDKGWCGSGAMPALSINGKIYPCFRWLPHTQEDADRSEAFCVGDIWDGINRKENFRKIREATRRVISPKECLECEYEICCAYCIGGCYSEFGCLKRTTHICEITKIISKYAEMYWKKVQEADGITL